MKDWMRLVGLKTSSKDAEAWGFKPCLWEILVPTLRDATATEPEKRFFSTRHHKAWDAEVRNITGGLSVHPKNINGEWIAPDGELFSEQMIHVRVMCYEDQMEKIADLTARHYQQQAIMFYKLSDDVRIKHY